MPRVSVLIDPDSPEKSCNGCRMCEMICAFTHEKSCNPAKSRIRIVSIPPLVDVPVLCRQCKNPPCAKDCPANALMVHNGIVTLNGEKCIGCGKCAEVCPFGAISVHPANGSPLICDLCGGDPKCVKYCPIGVLKISRSTGRPYNRTKWALKCAAPALKHWGLEGTST